MRLLQEADVQDKVVLVRVGYDVPTDSHGQISDDLRIQESLPTINYLLPLAKRLILLSHRGRPDGHLDPEDSLLPTAQYLEGLIKEPVFFVTEKLEEKITQSLDSSDAKIVMLENLRFHDGEETNDPRFAQWLASLGDVYINDAFSDCHRAHTSMVGLPRLLPSFAGLALEKEVTTLSQLLTTPEHPVIAIIGGAKLESKLPVIEHLLPLVDQILIGSKFVGETLPESGKIILPQDTVQEGEAHLDIGPRTIAHYCEIIASARTIFWSGPLGLFEKEGYAEGTEKTAQAVSQSPGKKIVGGGDTLAALRKFNLLDQMTFTSTGGSAMLEFLGGKKLPGLEVLA
jgi:phosphoglycerate kinase